MANEESETQAFWATSNESNTQRINHMPWQAFLDKYIQPSESNINLIAYKKVSQDDHQTLKSYLSELSKVTPSEYSRSVQMAYWINLYNAATVDLILDNYPVKSITKLGDSFFSFGPWDDPIITIDGKTLTLNTIEHKILRPIWQDPRIHYAVNCASYSCPNLATLAYTADNLENLLNQGASDYINHPRGVRFEEDELILSKIYSWYQEDFGDNENDVISHLQHYAKPALEKQLRQLVTDSGDIDYEYDWRLNELK
jgi:hypothetical protein